VRLREGVSPDDLRFDNLGYGDWALESHGIFTRLKQAGEIPAGMRFQVDLPHPQIPLIFTAAPGEIPKLLPAYEAGLFAEIDRMLTVIPKNELVIQWDCTQPGRYGDADPDSRRSIVENLIRVGNKVPAGVGLGFHLCYGDNVPKHMRRIKDLGAFTEIANLVSEEVTRDIAWFHMPVPLDRSDDAYFAPLQGLDIHPETEVVLGLVHLTDGLEGTRRRMETASKVVSRFAIATECGFGRRPAETVPQLLELHAQAADLVL
jgi:hypothetical protein